MSAASSPIKNAFLGHEDSPDGVGGVELAAGDAFGVVDGGWSWMAFARIWTVRMTRIQGDFFGGVKKRAVVGGHGGRAESA